MLNSFNLSNSLPFILLPLLCVSFDEALKISWINRSDISRAFVDNAAHGGIAFLSWLAVSGLTRRGFVESSFCAVLASCLDLDHFLAAKSFSLRNALSLQKRPPFHSTSSLIPVLPIVIIISSCYPSLWNLPFLTMVSVLSHHLRDSQRRGIWFWPLGNTRPVPYLLYLFLIVLVPLSTSVGMRLVVRNTNIVINI